MCTLWGKRDLLFDVQCFSTVDNVWERTSQNTACVIKLDMQTKASRAKQQLLPWYTPMIELGLIVSRSLRKVRANPLHEAGRQRERERDLCG